MDTLIELYDTNSLFNISAAVALKPEHIFFLCGSAVSNEKKGITEDLLHKYVPGAKIKFLDVNLKKDETVKDALFKITSDHPDCAIELTGGSELLSYLAGKYAPEINAFTYRVKSGNIHYVSGPERGKSEKCRIDLTIDDFAFMAGGRYAGNGHFNAEDFREDFYEKAEGIWKVFLEHKNEWRNVVGFFQTASFSPNGEYRGPQTLKRRDGSELTISLSILRKLYDCGVLKELKTNGNKIFFAFEIPEMVLMMNDFGIWLEIHIYKAAIDSGKFKSVEMSVILDWNDVKKEYGNVTNEIDVFITKGTTPLFISCKAGSNIETNALNELSVLSARFGSNVAKAVLITAEDLSKISASTYKRAMEMGIRVIDLSEIGGDRTIELLERIINND